MTAINYSELTDEEAIDILKNDFGSRLIEDRQNEIISAPDVLYYADAYGDLESAILLQGWDKTLPDTVHKGLLDSGLDIYEAVNTHDIDEEKCPHCDSKLYPFEIDIGRGYTKTKWISEWGDVTGEYLEFVENKDQYLWNANPDENDAPVLCPACSIDRGYEFPKHSTDPGSVRVHYGEFNEISGFSIIDNLVRFDFAYHDNMTDLYPLPDGEEGLPKALASGEHTEWLDANNWTEIALETVKEHEDVQLKFGNRTTSRLYKQIVQDWAESNETHPDLDFSYVIDFSTFGSPSLFVSEENEDRLLAEIVDLIERRA